MFRPRVCSSCGWHGPRYALTRWGDGYICRNDELCFARYKLHLDDERKARRVLARYKLRCELWHRLHGPDEVSVATVDGVQLYVRRDVAQNREFAEVLADTVTWFRQFGAAQARRDGADIVHIP